LSEANFEGGHPGPEWLSAWHDGELHDEAAAAVRQHLDGCAACRHLLEEYRLLDQGARLADDAAPDAAAWEGIEGRLRQRLEDELGLGIPVGAATRYVETEAELVLRPSLSEVRGGKGARPFRLRWTFATAAGLGLGILILRTLSDSGWTVSGVLDPAADRRRNPAVATKASPARQEAARPAEQEAAPTAGEETATLARPEAQSRAKDFAAAPAPQPAAGSAVAERDEAASGLAANAPPPAASAPSGAIAEADRYLADVEQVLRGKESAGSDGAERHAALQDRANESRRDAGALSAEAPSDEAIDDARAVATKSEPGIDPALAAVFAAASRARESGEHALARRGFDLVAGAVPDHPLARDAEFEARLAEARADIARERTPGSVRAELEREAVAAWEAALGGGVADCRRALALWRTVRALDADTGQPAAQRDADERVARLRACAG
jgi:hypothetical protein